MKKNISIFNVGKILETNYLITFWRFATIKGQEISKGNYVPCSDFYPRSDLLYKVQFFEKGNKICAIFSINFLTVSCQII